MYNKKCKDPIYFNVQCAVTYTLNKIKGEAADKEVDELTDGYFKLVGEFNGAMGNLAERQVKELG